MKTGNVRLLREQGEAMNRAEARLLRDLSIPEGVQSFIALYRMSKAQLDATETHFRIEREAYLALLQKRLKRHGIWEKKQRPRPLYKRGKPSKAAQ